MKSGQKKPVPLLKTDIAWPTDKTVKFKNPSGFSKSAEEGDYRFKKTYNHFI